MEDGVEAVAALTVKLVAGVLPNETAVAASRPVPLMLTDVPPAMGPEFGVTAKISGGSLEICTEPRSMTAPAVEGRGAPRWSVVGSPATKMPVPRAALPESGGMVWVAPP